MPMRAWMSSIMGQIVPEHPELFALEFGKIAESDFVYTLVSTNIDQSIAIFNFVYTLASANIDQPVPNLATIYMPIKSQMCSILGQIESEHPELFALEFGKIAESDFVYNPASTNIDRSEPDLVKMYVTIRLQMSSIMDLIGPEL